MTEPTSIVHALASDVILNADRTRMYIARYDGIVSVYDTITGRVIDSFDVGTKLGGMDLSADGSFLLVVDKQPQYYIGGATVFAVHKVDVATGAVTSFRKTFYSIDGPFHDVALLADGTAVVTTTLRGSGGTTTYRLDTQSGVFGGLTGESAQAPVVTASADRLHILLTPGFNVGGPIEIYDLTAEAVVERSARRGASNLSSVNAFAPDGSLAAYVDHGGIDIFDSRLNKLTTIAEVGIGGLAFDDHGDNLYVRKDLEILQISTTDWSIVARIGIPTGTTFGSAGRGYGGNLVVGPDAQYFTITSNSDLFRIDNPTAQTPMQGTGAAETINGAGAPDLIYGLAGNDVLNGRGGNDTLRGGAGNDVLDGGTGHDALYGGDGDDIYVVDDVRDRAAEVGAGGGRDEVRASVDFVLEGNIERLVLTGGGAIDGTGNAIANLISGNGAANRLIGMGGDDVLAAGAGNDTIDGGTGDDLLDGGAGRDALQGGDGNDIFIVDNALDVVIETDAGGGSDEVRSSVGFMLGDNVERLVLTGDRAINGAGNALANTLVGNGAANRLIGMGGNDVLAGGTGNDTLDGGAGDDVIDGGSGTDTLDYALVGAGVTANLISQSAQNTGGAGMDTIRGIENVIGTAFNDALTGNEFGNILTGGNGDDLLVGNLGNDTLAGGAGIDTASYATATAGVRVNLALATAQSTGGAGSDTVSGIENLNGSAFDDQFTGDGGNNVLTGNAGNDVLVGGLGNDTLSGGAGIDTVSYASAAIGVTVSLLVTAAQNTVGAGIDTFASIENLVGSAQADTLTGNAQNNAITGGIGDDLVDGGSGADTLDGGNGNDVLKGGGGDDVLIGNAGRDMLTGGAGNDRFVYLATGQSPASANADRILDFAAGDVLDLSAIDANSGATGDQAFVKVATFSGVAGQLTLAFDAGANTTTLRGDTDGNGVADFSILFSGDVTALTGTWVL